MDNISYPIENDGITVNFYDGIRGVKTELRHKVLLRVSICEIYIDIIKKILLCFPWQMKKRNSLY